MRVGHCARSVVNKFVQSRLNLLYRWKETMLSESGPAATGLVASLTSTQSLKIDVEFCLYLARERSILWLRSELCNSYQSSELSRNRARFSPMNSLYQAPKELAPKLGRQAKTFLGGSTLWASQI